MPAMLPPQLTGQPNFGHSPMGQPSANPGQMANGVAMLRQALEILQKALSMFPAGSEPHTATLQSITKLSKLAPSAEASPGVQKTEALAGAQQAQQQNPMVSMMRAMGPSEQPTQ